MNLQIKSLAGELREDQKKYLRKRLLGLDKYLSSGAVLVAGIRHNITKKSNQAYEVILHLTIPRAKRPIYTKVYRHSFNEAVDLAKGKLERVVLKKKDKSSRLRFKLPSLKLLPWRKKSTDEKNI